MEKKVAVFNCRFNTLSGSYFNLPVEQWKDFANSIETELAGQRPLFDYPQKLRALARKYARTIIHQATVSKI